jgi:methylmalonyl-CoA mutase N-terminal domain/subunit
MSNRLEVNSSGSGSITINSISIDYAGAEAQVDLTYTITDGVATLTGQFDGRVDLLKGL